MMRWSRRAGAAGLLALAATAACGTPPREPAPAPVPATHADPGERGYTGADVRFMQEMIAHHAQALTMTGLVPARSSRPEIHRLAERMEVSQRDEIAQMQRWLRERGREAPGPEAHHGHPMRGMLAPEEMARLAEARGAEFDRLFLELMVRHHEGALEMVAALFGSPGAAQETEVYQIASEVDADQRMEIARMRELLGRLPGR